MNNAGGIRVLMLDPAGSSAHVSHNLCNHLSRMGCDVHVLTAPHWLRATGTSEKTEYQVHVCFYRGTQIRSYQAKSGFVRVWWRVVRLVQHIRAMASVCAMAREFDVVHTQILPLPALDYVCLAIIARRTPIVCTVHELVPHTAKYRRLTGKSLQRIYRLASVLFVYTEYTRNRLIQEQRVPSEKIFNVPHGNLEHLLDLTSGVDDEQRSHPPIVLFLGSIRPDKGLDTLIKAGWHLRKKVPSFKVMIAGVPGFDLTNVRKLVSELDLQHLVDFHLGYVPESEFAVHLRRAAVVALPYRRVEQSGVAIAACTLGKAIVATRCGGLEELITEAGNGILVPIDNPGALADALATLLLDEGARRLCEVRSRSYAQSKLSWASIASRTMLGYDTAIRRLEYAERRVAPEKS